MLSRKLSRLFKSVKSQLLHLLETEIKEQAVVFEVAGDNEIKPELRNALCVHSWDRGTGSSFIDQLLQQSSSLTC